MKILSIKKAGVKEVNCDTTKDLGKKILRQVRENLLNAFDVYKTNVNYGIVEETEEKKKSITEWYLAILDLDAEALERIPQEVLRYVR